MNKEEIKKAKSEIIKDIFILLRDVKFIMDASKEIPSEGLKRASYLMGARHFEDLLTLGLLSLQQETMGTQNPELIQHEGNPELLTNP